MDNHLPEEWELLRHWLPEQMEAEAKETGFMQRARGVQDVEVWLRLILLHVGGGLSLEQTVVRAKELGLAHISAVALHKRLLRAGPWLQKLTRTLLVRRLPRSRTAGDWREEIVVVDATTVQEPGSTGTDWRVHYQVRLADLHCDHYELTSAKGGETLGRHRFQRGQIVLADRGYCHRAGAAQVVTSGADFVLRLQPHLFPLEDERGHPLDVAAWARRLAGHKPSERAAWFLHEGKRYKVRLCAVRKSRTATQRAQKKQRQKASRNGQKPQPTAVELAGYVMVVTSLERRLWPLRRVLNLYQHRWQVELVFKRLKSLLCLGHLPKTNDQSARAWMQAKILTALLIERAMYEARFFSPWGFPLEGEPMGPVS